jgi:hypothetical protein
VQWNKNVKMQREIFFSLIIIKKTLFITSDSNGLVLNLHRLRFRLERSKKNADSLPFFYGNSISLTLTLNSGQFPLHYMSHFHFNSIKFSENIGTNVCLLLSWRLKRFSKSSWKCSIWFSYLAAIFLGEWLDMNDYFLSKIELITIWIFWYRDFQLRININVHFP